MFAAALKKCSTLHDEFSAARAEGIQLVNKGEAGMKPRADKLAALKDKLQDARTRLLKILKSQKTKQQDSFKAMTVQR